MKILLLDQIASINYKYSFSLANALIALNHTVELVADDKKEDRFAKCKIYNKFSSNQKGYGKLRKLIKLFRAYFFSLRKAKSEHFDIVHLQWVQFSPVDYLFVRILKANGKKIIMTVHDILPFNEKKYDHFFHRKIYQLCDQIIVQAETNIKRFQDAFPESAHKIHFVPHGHFLTFAETHPMGQARDYLKIPHQKFVFLFFGQIKKVKGVGVLLKSFSKLLKDKSNAYLVVAGNTWKDEFELYKKIIEEENLQANNLKLDIRFIPDEEVGYYYSACNIAVLPYLDVYQSGVVQLAYAYKKPVIATSIPAFMEIVENEKTGLLCDANSVQSLCSAMMSAMENASCLEQWGELGYQKIAEKFSWEKIAKDVSSVYLK